MALGTNCGTLFASAIWALLVVVTEQQLLDWAWRVPFIASAIVMVFAVWVRFNLKESPVFEARGDVVDSEAVAAGRSRTTTRSRRRRSRSSARRARSPSSRSRSPSCSGSDRPGTPA